MTEVRAAGPPDGKKSDGKRSTEHTIWFLGLFAVVFVGVRLLIVSRGNLDTAFALAQNLNVTAILLATILPFITIGTVLFWAGSLAAVWHSARTHRNPLEWNKAGNTNPAQMAVFAILIIGPFAVALAWYAMPIKYLILAGIIAVVVLLIYLLSLSSKLKLLSTALAVLLLSGLIFVGGWKVIAQDNVWLPRERLTIGWLQTDIVYVLAVEDPWTKYIDAESHMMHLVPTKAVTGRSAIAPPDDWPNQTASEFFSQ